MDNKVDQDKCNHRFNRYECVKCGKRRPGSSNKVANYKVEKAAKVLTDQFMSKCFKGWY